MNEAVEQFEKKIIEVALKTGYGEVTATAKIQDKALVHYSITDKADTIPADKKILHDLQPL